MEHKIYFDGSDWCYYDGGLLKFSAEREAELYLLAKLKNAYNVVYYFNEKYIINIHGIKFNFDHQDLNLIKKYEWIYKGGNLIRRYDGMNFITLICDNLDPSRYIYFIDGNRHNLCRKNIRYQKFSVTKIIDHSIYIPYFTIDEKEARLILDCLAHSKTTQN